MTYTKKADREFLNALSERQKSLQTNTRWEITQVEFERAHKLGMTMWKGSRLIQRDFKDMNFYCNDFTHCVLNGSTFIDCNLTGARFNHSELNGVQFINCDLNASCFYSADMRWCKFQNSDLETVNFNQAYIGMVKGLKIVDPVGDHGRLVYAWVIDGEIHIQAGCRNAAPLELREAIERDYWHDPDGLADYLDAVTLLENWGKREINRLKNPQAE